MHIPDGFLDAATCAATAVSSAAAIGVALRQTRRELDDLAAPMTGLVAAFVFAAQMLNFPVAAGTSGHLIGAALAVALVGPWAATLCLTVVLAVQCFLFADGGLTALGANVWNMAVVGVWTAWLVQRLVLQLAGRRLAAVPLAAGLAGLASVVAAATSFCVLFALGGTVDVPLAQLVGAMVSVHALIGLGEGVATALVVAAVARTRPDLVHAARGLLGERPVELRDPAGVRA